jgi:hypothetical protein
VRFAAWCFVLALLPASAAAQSRAARVLALSGDFPGALVARDRVYVPSVNGALSACVGDRCAAVLRSDECQVPRCPGAGQVLVLDAPIANVDDLPTDRDGWNRALDAMRSDPALAAIAWSFGTHPAPPPEPARWITPSRRETFAWEASAFALGGVLGATGVPLLGGEANVGVRFVWDPRNSDDDFLALLLGDVLGLDVRVRAFALAPAQAPSEWGVTIGLAPVVGYSPRSESFLLPTFYSIVVPELGVALRTNRDAAFYMGWSLPFAFLVSSNVGLQARASVLVVDDWVPGSDVEAIVSLSLGVTVR